MQPQLVLDPVRIQSWVEKNIPEGLPVTRRNISNFIAALRNSDQILPLLENASQTFSPLDLTTYNSFVEYDIRMEKLKQYALKHIFTASIQMNNTAFWSYLFYYLFTVLASQLYGGTAATTSFSFKASDDQMALIGPQSTDLTPTVYTDQGYTTDSSNASNNMFCLLVELTKNSTNYQAISQVVINILRPV